MTELKPDRDTPPTPLDAVQEVRESNESVVLRCIKPEGEKVDFVYVTDVWVRMDESGTGHVTHEDSVAGIASLCDPDYGIINESRSLFEQARQEYDAA